jgi:hypothetical protein
MPSVFEQLAGQQQPTGGSIFAQMANEAPVDPREAINSLPRLPVAQSPLPDLDWRQLDWSDSPGVYLPEGWGRKPTAPAAFRDRYAAAMQSRLPEITRRYAEDRRAGKVKPQFIAQPTADGTPQARVERMPDGTERAMPLGRMETADEAAERHLSALMADDARQAYAESALGWLQDVSARRAGEWYAAQGRRTPTTLPRRRDELTGQEQAFPTLAWLKREDFPAYQKALDATARQADAEGVMSYADTLRVLDEATGGQLRDRSALDEIITALAAGTARIGEMTGEFAGIVRRRVGEDPAGIVAGVEQAGQDIRRVRESNPEAFARSFRAQADRYSGPWWLAGSAEQLPQLAMMIGGGGAAYSGARLAGAGEKAARWIAGATATGMIGAQEAGGAASEINDLLLAQGVDPNEARARADLAGLGVGLANAAIERLPFGEFMLKDRRVMSAVARVLRGMAIEGGTEGAQELTAILGEFAAGRNQPWAEEDTLRLVDSLGLGAVTGAAPGVVETAAQRSRISEQMPGFDRLAARAGTAQAPAATDPVQQQPQEAIEPQPEPQRTETAPPVAQASVFQRIAEEEAAPVVAENATVPTVSQSERVPTKEEWTASVSERTGGVLPWKVSQSEYVRAQTQRGVSTPFDVPGTMESMSQNLSPEDDVTGGSFSGVRRLTQAWDNIEYALDQGIEGPWFSDVEIQWTKKKSPRERAEFLDGVNTALDAALREIGLTDDGQWMDLGATTPEVLLNLEPGQILPFVQAFVRNAKAAGVSLPKFNAVLMETANPKAIAREDHRGGVQYALELGIDVDRVAIEDYRGEPWADAALAQLEQPAGEATQQAPAPKPSGESGQLNPPAETAPDYGASNTLVTRDAYERARDRLRRRGASVTTYQNPLDPELAKLIKDLAVVGLYHFEAASRAAGRWVAASYKDWKASLTADVGEVPEDVLRRTWQATKAQRETLTRTARDEGAQTAQLARPATTRQAVAQNAARRQDVDQRLLRFRMRQQQAAANKAYRLGRDDVAVAHRELTELAQDALLPSQQAAIQRQISKTKTPRQFDQIAGRIELLASRNAIANRGGETILTDSDLLKYAMQKAEQASATAYLTGAREVVAAHDDLVQYARERGLSNAEIGRISGQLARSRTPSQRTRAIASIDMLVAHEKQQAALREFRQAKKDLDLAHLRPSEQKAARQLLDAIQETTPKAKTLDRLKSLQKFLESDQEGAPPSLLIDRMRATLDRLQGVPIAKLPAESILQIANALRELAHRSAMKNKLLFSRQYETRREAVRQATKAVEDYNRPLKKQPKPGEHAKRTDQNAFVRLLTWSQLSLDTITELLGGARSAVRDLLHDALVRGERLFAETHHAAIDYIRGELEKLGVSWKDIQKMQKDVVTIDLPTARDRGYNRVKSIQMTPAERIEFLCHASDPSTRNEMVKNRSMGIGFSRNRGGHPVALTVKDVVAIEKSATDLERKIAKAMKDYINGDLRAALNEAWIAENGYEVARRQDYWPRRRDSEFRAVDPDKVMQQWHDRLLEDQGIFKEREGAREPVLVGDAFVTFMAHVNKVSAYVGKNRASKDALTVLGDPDFTAAVKSRFKHGDELLRDLEAAVRDYTTVEMPSRTPMDRVISWLSRNMHIAALGLKPQIMIYQPVSYLTALTEVGGEHLMKFWNWRGALDENVRAEVFKWCPYLRSRYEGTGVQILSAYSGGDTLQAFYTGSQGGAIEQASMGGIQYMDQLAITNIWRACKAEAQSKGLSGDALMEYTADLAERVVRRTQPTWDELTISQVAREARHKPLYKIWSFFSSERNKNFNIAVRAVNRFNHSDRTAADQAHLARDLTVPLVVNSALVYAIRAAYFRALGMAWKAILGGDDEDRPAAGIGEHALGVLKQVFGNWVIGGDMIEFVSRSIERGVQRQSPAFADDMSNPLLRGAEAVGEALTYAVTAGLQAADDEQYKSGPRKGSPKAAVTASRATEAGLVAMGYLGGLPTEGLLQVFRPLLPHRRTPRPERVSRTRTRKRVP